MLNMMEKNSVTGRVVKHQNKLPWEAVECPSLEAFKNDLYKHLLGITQG